MNQLETSGLAALATGIGCLVGGVVLENLDSKDDQKRKAYKEFGYCLEVTGGVTAACGVALLGAGYLLGDSVGSGIGFYNQFGL